MKIVHVCICGIFCEDYAYQENLLTKYHRKMGHEVTVIAPAYVKLNAAGMIQNDHTVEKILPDGIKVIRLKPRIKSYKLNAHLHLFHNLKKTILTESPDLLFVHGVSSFDYLSLPAVKRKNPKMHIVFDNHGDRYNSCRNYLSRLLNGWIYRYLLVRRLIPAADRFYGVTPARCRFLHDVYGVPEEKIELLVMGADDERMQLERRSLLRAEVRAEYGVSEEDFLIVTGGKIDLKKNIHLLAEAVKRLDIPEIRLLIFGSITGELQDYFNNLESDRVVLVGWVRSDAVYRYFYAADLVVFPGLHSVLWEQAVAAKTPCAVSDIAGFHHVDFNGNCLFLENSTVDYYREIIAGVYADPSRRRILKENADSEQSRQFLYSRIARKVLDDLESEKQP